MFYDPVTKSLLSKYGGLSMVGYYEMANKLVQQCRSIIVSANQVLVPAFADLDERNPKKIRSVYLTSYNLLFYLASPLFAMIILCIPLISEIWIGHYERIFIIFGVLLSIGWFLNTLAAPAYFANLGTGDLRWNVIGHAIIGILNAGLGLILGFYFDGYGVAVAWIIAMSLGSAIIYFFYHHINGISFGELFPINSRVMFLFYSFLCVISFIIQRRIDVGVGSITLNSLLSLIFLLLVFIPFYLHPNRIMLFGWAREMLTKKNAI